MRRVDASRVGGDLRQRHDFVGLRVEAGDVAEPRAEADGAFVHRDTDHARHARQLVRRWCTIRRAHDLAANRVVSREVRDVDTEPGTIGRVEIGAEGPGSAAIRPA